MCLFLFLKGIDFELLIYFAMQDLTFREFRKDNLFQAFEEREKIRKENKY